jgi:hypothetical protein
MRDVIELRKGDVYFRAVFYDAELSIPSIETYVYHGQDDEGGHLFVNASGYVEKMEGVEEPDIYYLSFEPGTQMCILDRVRLIEWLQEEHSPKGVGTSYDYRAI